MAGFVLVGVRVGQTCLDHDDINDDGDDEQGIDDDIEEDTRESQCTTCTWSSIVSEWVDATIV